jgi:hypothetical protein
MSIADLTSKSDRIHDWISRCDRCPSNTQLNGASPIMPQSNSVATKYRKVEYNECPINIRLSDKWISLTDMWRAQGSPTSKRVNDWLNNDNIKPLLTVLAVELNTTPSCIYETRKGKGGGTFGIPKLALAYAEYLSPEFHSWALGTLIERIEEDADPELGITRSRGRAIAKWKRQGKSDEWINTRLKEIEGRNYLTDELQTRGINQPWQYGVCTNEIYKPILGGETKKVKEERGLPAKSNLRDSLDEVENAAIILAEAIARKKMRINELQGFKECRDACSESGEQVKKALD